MTRSDLRLLFGHQSVGTNILSGIAQISPELPIQRLDRQVSLTATAGITHCQIGQNCDPSSKMVDFEQILHSNKEQFNLAMLKFCYVDINRHTDVQEIFGQYRRLSSNISATLPKLRLVHSTVPIRRIKLGLRSNIRRITGSPIDAVEDNLRREQFNTLMRSKYGDSGTLFDLAKAQATRPNGKTESLRYHGSRVAMMCQEFSDDGGHLNDDGQKAIAAKLLRQLCTLTESEGAPENAC